MEQNTRILWENIHSLNTRNLNNWLDKLNSTHTCKTEKPNLAKQELIFTWIKFLGFNMDRTILLAELQ